MKVRLVGTNDKGDIEIIREPNTINLSSYPLGNFIADVHHEYPNATRLEISIVYPDPEVVKLKEDMLTIVARGMGNRKSPEYIVSKLFDGFNIKPLEKKNA